jgi:hypothetical protein
VTMRRLALLAGVLITTGALVACGGDDDTSALTSALPARQVDSGAVEVKITPARLDDTGAAFEIVLDTHSVELALDVAAAATLEVDGTAWSVDGWDGSRPGGHHREGTLRFTAGGPASGIARLTITGLPEPVEATWDLDGS